MEEEEPSHKVNQAKIRDLCNRIMNGTNGLNHKIASPIMPKKITSPSPSVTTRRIVTCLPSDVPSLSDDPSFNNEFFLPAKTEYEVQSTFPTESEKMTSDYYARE